MIIVQNSIVSDDVADQALGATWDVARVPAAWKATAVRR